jgi:hypothetical protein
MLIYWRLLRGKAWLIVGSGIRLLRALLLCLSSVVLLRFGLCGSRLLLLKFGVRPFLWAHLVLW